MNTDLKSAQDDLAFLRGIVEGGGRPPKLMGELFVSGGLLYAAQTLYHWAQATGAIAPPPIVTLLVVVGVTTAFLAHMTYLIIRDRRVSEGGSANRAVIAAFRTLGYSNLVVIALFGIVAYRRHDFVFWLLYPCIIFILQGAGWLVAASILKRRWYMAVGLGWFAAVIGMALTLGSEAYLLVIVAALLLFMALPGYLLTRAWKKGA